MASFGCYFLIGLGWMRLMDALMYFEWNSQLTADQIFVEPTKKDNCFCFLR